MLAHWQCWVGRELLAIDPTAPSFPFDRGRTEGWLLLDETEKIAFGGSIHNDIELFHTRKLLHGKLSILMAGDMAEVDLDRQRIFQSTNRSNQIDMFALEIYFQPIWAGEVDTFFAITSHGESATADPMDSTYNRSGEKKGVDTLKLGSIGIGIRRLAGSPTGTSAGRARSFWVLNNPGS